MMPSLTTSAELLWAILLVPLFGAIVLPLIRSERVLNLLAFGISSLSLILGALLLYLFDPSDISFQFASDSLLIQTFGIRLSLGVDGISVWSMFFTSLLMFIATIKARTIKHSRAGYLALLFLLQFAVLGTFSALDLVLYYFFWELMLIPNFFILYCWGSSQKAAYKYALFTTLGSLLMLVAIIGLGVLVREQRGEMSFLVSNLMGLSMTERVRDFVFFGFLAAFFLKSAVFPFHGWLPDAHRAAPEGGSFDLTLVLPKMGLFGAIRFLFLLFPESLVRHETLLGTMGVTALIYGALVAWKQTDLKRFLAFATVSHVGLSVAALSTLSEDGVKGCLFMMLGSCISTGGLLLLVSSIESKSGIHLIDEHGGIALKAPKLAFLFLLFLMSAIGVPLTNGFIGEILSIAGTFDSSDILGVFASLGMVFGAVYALSLYRRVFFGVEKIAVPEIELQNLLPILPLAACVFYFGLFPKPVLSGIEQSLDLMESIQGLAEEASGEQ